ncbi:MAG: ABC transporter ATP-binding protein [Rhodobiaceae bacterium]|nr:ABC transporter ATP-binding protein [Hyphomonas sp.]MCB9971181.1 ABC transporter ATP-binding protein [Hyphomonas sp.]MCC0050250.1 ABC transporter ATP-binding protein [Rhodobiaceae bacterium]
MDHAPDLPDTGGRPDALMWGKGLERTFRTGEVEVRALRGVDVSLRRGELVVLLGPSGSGKSTLLNILGGLDRPTAGSLNFDGRDLTAANDAELTRYRRRSVGFVFQFYNLVAGLTARENVSLVTEIADNPMKPEEALELVGLGERIQHFPAQLSGGEQQRVAVARAIAKRPQILFCDEPTGALDSKTGVRVLEALERVNIELSTTILIITHNVGIGDIADRVLRMQDGRIIEETAPNRRLKPQEISW